MKSRPNVDHSITSPLWSVVWTSLQLNVEFGRHDCVDSGAQNPPDPRAPWNASHPSHCRERSAISTICKRHVFIRLLRHGVDER